MCESPWSASRGVQVYYCYQLWNVGKEERRRCFKSHGVAGDACGNAANKSPAVVDHEVPRRVQREGRAPALLSHIAPKVTCVPGGDRERAQAKAQETAGQLGKLRPRRVM